MSKYNTKIDKAQVIYAKIENFYAWITIGKDECKFICIMCEKKNIPYELREYDKGMTLYLEVKDVPEF